MCVRVAYFNLDKGFYGVVVVVVVYLKKWVSQVMFGTSPVLKMFCLLQ